jgi:hypothetical protein
MADLQLGRGKSKKVFKKPKDFKKAERMYREVFNEDNKVGAQDKIWKKKYSRVTHKQISKNLDGKI